MQRIGAMAGEIVTRVLYLGADPAERGERRADFGVSLRSAKAAKRRADAGYFFDSCS